MQTKTGFEIMQEFEKLSSKKKIETLWCALSLMEQSNTRSQGDCVALSMGYEHGEENNTYIKQKT